MNPSISQFGGDNSIQIGYIEHVGQMNFGSRVLKVNIGSLTGGVINIASPDVYIAPTPRSAPVYLFPRPFPLLRGREEEVKAAVSLLPYEQSVEFHGLAGIGKTALLRHLAHHPIIKSAFPDGLIYHRVTYGQTVTDILQVLFNAFYDCKTPTKACDSEIHRVLQGRKALIILDGLDLKREELDRLINYLPSFTFLITGFEQHLWGEAKSVELQGLPLSAALALVTQELGQQLQPAEQAGAEKLCTALEGHPLKILQAVAWAKAERKSLVAIAQQVSTAAAKEIWAATLLAPLSKPQRWIIALLAALGANVALGAEAISSITGLSDAKAILETLLQRQLVEIDGGRVRLASSLLKELQQQSALTSWMDRTSSFLIQWVQQHKNSPDVILQESDAILRTLEWAAEAGRWSDVITLGRAIEGGLALSGQWGSWEIVLQSVLEAARASGDQAVEAFALHELGTRSLCLNQLDEAQTYLSQALQIRESLGDQAAAEATTHNLNFLQIVSSLQHSELGTQPQSFKYPRINRRLIGGGVLSLAFSLGAWLLFPDFEANSGASSTIPTILRKIPFSPIDFGSSPGPQELSIDSFSADPISIKPGQSSDLCYRLTGARSAEINNEIGAIAVPEDCKTVTPEQTTTFTLTATGKTGETVLKSVTVTVQQENDSTQSLSIDSFIADPISVEPGQSSDLCYRLIGATSAEINNEIGAITVPEGCETVTPGQTTTFTLTAIGETGKPVEKSVTVTVKPANDSTQSPSIDSFIADPISIKPGESSDLCYRLTGATSAEINNGIGAIAVPEGCKTVTPEQTTTFTLTAIGETGETVEEPVTVSVQSEPTDPEEPIGNEAPQVTLESLKLERITVWGDPDAYYRKVTIILSSSAPNNITVNLSSVDSFMLVEVNDSRPQIHHPEVNNLDIPIPAGRSNTSFVIASHTSQQEFIASLDGVSVTYPFP